MCSTPASLCNSGFGNMKVGEWKGVRREEESGVGWRFAHLRTFFGPLTPPPFILENIKELKIGLSAVWPWTSSSPSWSPSFHMSEWAEFLEKAQFFQGSGRDSLAQWFWERRREKDGEGWRQREKGDTGNWLGQVVEVPQGGTVFRREPLLSSPLLWGFERVATNPWV